MSVTIKEIAKICGVSRGTVDRALNDRPNINPETKKRIMKIAEEMGYRPHFLAKSLSTGKTSTIGIIVFDLYNEFFASLIHSAQLKSLEAGYGLNIMVSNRDKKLESECLDSLLDRNVDGIILSSVNNNSSYINKLINSNKPIVSIGNRINPAIPFVGIDDYKAMKDATAFILSQGYEDIVLVSPPLRYKGKQNIHAPYERYKGFKDAIKATKKQVHVIKDKDYPNKIHPYIKDSNKKTAFLCNSDIFALDILAEIKKSYMKIPDHIGIMGFDNLSMLQYIQPTLTTVSYPLSEVGQLAVTLLLDLINGLKDKKNYILDHSIIQGKTL